MLKIGFVSLGCSKNQVDTEVMLHEVLTEGFENHPGRCRSGYYYY